MFFKNVSEGFVDSIIQGARRPTYRAIEGACSLSMRESHFCEPALRRKLHETTQRFYCLIYLDYWVNSSF